jgi:flagellar basal body-associated protein FliL
VSDDKKKEGDGKADDGKKKKGLPPIVMIAVGAIVGGAGAVFAIPPKTVEIKKAEPVYEMVDVLHPDVIQHEFNPRTKAGKGIGRVHFKFRYTVREDLESAAFEQIKSNWDQAQSNSLLLLKTRGMEELQSEAGIRMLEADMMADLDSTLFPPKGGEKVAKVNRIVWVKWLMQ